MSLLRGGSRVSIGVASTRNGCACPAGPPRICRTVRVHHGNRRYARSRR